LQRIREELARYLDVTPPQYSMLMQLARSENTNLTTSELAAALGVTLAFVVTESSKLAAKDYVDRRRNPRDARSVLICLTDRGRQRIQQAAPMICTVNDRLFAPLTPSSMRVLARTNVALLKSANAAMSLLQADRSRADDD
jgi:DNA-binding MarR family transcriptional regulator